MATIQTARITDPRYKDNKALWLREAKAGYSAQGKSVEQIAQMWDQRYGNSSTSGSATPSGTPSSSGSSGGMAQTSLDSFQKALDTLSSSSADLEKTYQTGKRRTMSNIAMQSVNSGMANTLNMPAAELAYEGSVRPGMNTQLAQAQAGVLQNLGQTAAGMYGVDVGASTSRYSTDVGSQTQLQTAQIGADTSLAGYGMQFASNQANQALQKYIAELNAGLQAGTAKPVATTLRAPTV